MTTYASFAPFHIDIDDGSFNVDGNVPCSNFYCKVYALQIKNLNQERKKERQKVYTVWSNLLLMGIMDKTSVQVFIVEQSRFDVGNQVPESQGQGCGLGTQMK